MTTPPICPVGEGVTPRAVFVGPEADVTVVAAVTGAGAEVVASSAVADAIVWLGYEPDDLRPHLHERIRWVQLSQAGINRWVAAGCVDERRLWTSAAGAFGEAVGERAVALLLATVHRLPAHARGRSWTRHVGNRLAGARVLVVGTGAIGRAVAVRVAALGAVALGLNRDGTATVPFSAVHPIREWPLVLDDVDHVVLAVPSTERTRRMVDAQALRRLPGHGVLVNVARGDLVVTDDLVRALRDGRLAGAALDVTDPEPLPDGHPLWDLPSVLVTSHTANPQPERTRLLAEHVGENVGRWLAGEPLLGQVDLRRGY
jgi:phosphoglycerate dehydrogenase-like enzyme